METTIALLDMEFKAISENDILITELSALKYKEHDNQFLLECSFKYVKKTYKSDLFKDQYDWIIINSIDVILTGSSHDYDILNKIIHTSPYLTKILEIVLFYDFQPIYKFHMQNDKSKLKTVFFDCGLKKAA